MTLPLVAVLLLLSQTSAPPPAKETQPPPLDFSSKGLPDPMVPPKDAGLPLLTLEQALAQASNRNLDLKAAIARYEAAKEIVWKTASGYLPQLAAQGSYTRNNIGAVFAAPTGLYIRQGVPETNYYAPPPANLPGTVPNPALTVVPTYQKIVVQEENQWQGNIHGSQNLLALSLIASIRSSTLTARAAGLRRAAEVQAQLLEIQTAREKDAEVRFGAGSVNKIYLLSAQIGKTQA